MQKIHPEDGPRHLEAGKSRGQGFREDLSRYQQCGQPGVNPGLCHLPISRELVITETNLLWVNVHVSVRLTPHLAKCLAL